MGAPAKGPNGTGIDLGREPPLSVGDTREGLPQRRSISIRWLTGTVLTGFTSTILMGGALMAALDGRHQLAFPPEAGRTLRASEAGGDVPLTNGSKGDRIRMVREPASDRQVVQVSTVTKQGDRDLIKLKPFAKIATSIATTITALSDDVPPYDPAKIVAAAAGDRRGNEEPAPTTTEKLDVIQDEGASGDGGDEGLVAADGADVGSSGDGDVAASGETAIGPGQEQIYGVNVEGEVSIKVVDFPIDQAPGDEEPSFSPTEAEQIARAAIQPTGAGNNEIAPLAYVDPDRFSFDESGTDPFSALGVRIVPENVSFVSKSGSSLGSDERIAVVDKKETLDEILSENDVSVADSANIIAAMSDLLDLSDLHAGQKVRILYSSEGEMQRPMRVSIYEEGSHQATVARRDDDSFVRADEPETSTDEFETADQAAPSHDGPMPRLYQALYETALEQKIPDPLITELVHIFSYDVDFQSRVSPGDSLEVFHSLPEADSGQDDEEILYAAITLDGATKRYYRYRSPDDGVVDYFDEEGRSAKKFLIRKPMNGGVLRSNFGYRKHPILGYKRLHPGVDWAAPRGTPILAAGNGVVEKAGWSSGYGNFTLIRHTNGYESAYGHQSAIAKGIRPGTKVRQGQLIGYVGSTGLSTGPHLHYEVRINDKPVDPLRVRLPRGRVLQGDILAAFKQEKARIDTLIGTPANSKVAAVAIEEDATN
jgi:murein DD-endopeptidase MepM/ murein hydrolase activator NlpD